MLLRVVETSSRGGSAGLSSECVLELKKHRELDELQQVRGTAGVNSPVDVARSMPRPAQGFLLSGL